MSAPRPLTRRRAITAGSAVIATVVAACTQAARRAPAGAAGSTASRAPSAPTSSTAPPSTASTPSNPGPFGGPANPAAEVMRGSGQRAEIALTFHGAGDPVLAQQTLSTLQGRGARVTVMAIGTWLQANPLLAQTIIAGGHEIGNHTWTHPNLAALSPAKIDAEITQCRDLIASLTGTYGPFFRQSQGQHATPEILAAAARAGYPTVLSYDVDSHDWQDTGAVAIRANLAQATAGSVVSMHLGHPGTLDALPGVLDDLAARGLAVVPASQVLSPS